MEFALLLPFLAILVFGTVDLGRGYQLKNQVTNMAREGAFYAQLTPGRVDCPTGEDIIGRVQGEAPGLPVTVTVERRSGGSLTPLTGCSTAVPPGDEVLVTVTTDMTILTPLVGAITGPVISVDGFAEVVVLG